MLVVAATGTGIGPALQKARLLRGKSIDEASRETHIRAEYLHALEGESFDAMLGDVYVRGFLRSYSSYLGLDPGKVLTVYNRHFGPPRLAVPEQVPGPVRVTRAPHPHLHHPFRHHPSWVFLITVAVFVLGVLAAVGVLSRSRATPQAEGPTPATSIPVLPPTVTVSVQARAQLSMTIRIDGRKPVRVLLRKGEGRSFKGNSRIELTLQHGGSARVTVNGHSLGTPGEPHSPFTMTFTPQSYRRSTSPTPGASPKPVSQASPTPRQSGP
jgi:cytoskeleton protein RodZ